MKKVRGFLLRLLVDTAIIGSLVAGQFWGLEWAANVGWFVIFIMSILGILVGMGMCIPKEGQKKSEGKKRSVLFIAYRYTTNSAITLLVASAGWFFLATIFCLSWLCMEAGASARSEKEKTEEEGKQQ